MFTGAVVGRGVMYTLLMLVGKLVTCMCLVRIAVAPKTMAEMVTTFANHVITLRWNCLNLAKSREYFRSGTMAKADGSELKAMPDVDIALAPDGEQGPTLPSDRPSPKDYI